jgi:hypothetical protein
LLKKHDFAPVSVVRVFLSALPRAGPGFVRLLDGANAHTQTECDLINCVFAAIWPLCVQTFSAPYVSEKLFAGDVS